MKTRIRIPAAWAKPRPLFTAPDPRMEPVRMAAWKSLFDGKSLNGWVIEDGKDLWKVEDSTIYCIGNGGGYLRSADQFENYVLALEFKVTKETNSGVFVRWSDIKDPVNTGIEIQVMDTAGKATPDKHDSGAIYDLVAPSSNPMKGVGEWNQMVIACQGPMISVALNGVPIAETDISKYKEAGKSPDGTVNKFKFPLASLPRKGYIGLQNHGKPVWYRNVLVLPL